MSGAIAQGPSVAKGDTHNQVVLQTRHPKRQKVSLRIDGDEVVKRNTKDDDKENEPFEGKKVGESSAASKPGIKQQVMHTQVPNMQMNQVPNMQMHQVPNMQMHQVPNMQI